jgi:multiple sugar transport system substrate-binding protein
MMKSIDPSVLSILFLIVLILNLGSLTVSDLTVISSVATEAVDVYAQSNQKEKVTLTLLLSADGERWDPLLDGAKQELQKRYPDKVIEIQNKTLPYEEIRPQLLEALTNGTSIDLISIDQIWLGEFAENGLLTDLTDFIKKGMISPAGFYQANWDGGVSENKVHAIWIWTISGSRVISVEW